MSRGIQTFRASDLKKALEAAVNNGLHPQRVEIGRDGKIILIIQNVAQPDATVQAA